MLNKLATGQFFLDSKIGEPEMKEIVNQVMSSLALNSPSLSYVI